VSAAQHTPGPWKVGPRPHGNCRVYAASESHAIVRTYGPDLNGIGVCELTGPRNEADARLIAAAPDLLHMLVTALPYVEDAQADPCYKTGAVATVVKQMRAAIAQANPSAGVIA